MTKIAIVCCSVMKHEVAAILAQDFPDIEAVFLDSMLHMHPKLLEQTLESKLRELACPALVIYGDCSPAMHSLEDRFVCARTTGVNCCELLLGHERYLADRNGQAFLLLPEWTKRWKEVFQKELGFKDMELARSFMHEYRTSIKYIDTGFVPVPEDTLREISDFFDMPISIEKTDDKSLRAIIHEAMQRLQRRLANGMQPS